MPTPRRWKYGSLVKMSLQSALAYRGVIIIEWFIDAWSVAIMLYIWRTVFATEATQIGSYDWQRMKTYLVLAYAINSFSASGIIWQMGGLIRNGDIATELTRPISFFGAQFASQLGSSLVSGVIGMGLVAVLSVVLLGLVPPASLFGLALFVLSLGLSYLIRFCFDYLIGLSACWLTNTQGINWIVWFGVRLISGAVIPITLFPGWLYTLASVFPFRGIVADPIAIYLGDAPGLAALQLMGLQLAWVIALWLLSRWLWPRAMRALEIQGG
jgi:ABC-2 type transport system permease protein